MDKSPTSSDARLDELYRQHPAGFIAGRDQLVRDLRAAGEREEADRVKKLRRPTVAAWLINRAALESPARLEEFVAASRQLEEAQSRALDGTAKGAAEWRAAAAREREVTGVIVEVAETAARDAGHPASERALELVGETLRAATGDPELRERVRRGRVEKERSAATLGTPATGRPPKTNRQSAKRREIGQARRERRGLEEDLADATAREERLRARVEQAADALRQERARLADSKRETADLRRRLKAAQRRAQA